MAQSGGDWAERGGAVPAPMQKKNAEDAGWEGAPGHLQSTAEVPTQHY